MDQPSLSKQSLNFWAALAWLLGIFGAIVVVLFRPTNRVAAFHAKQSLLWNTAVLLALIVFSVLDAVFFRLGFIGFIIAGVVIWTSRLIRLTGILVALLMAYQGLLGKEFSIPVIGAWATKIKF